MGERIGLTQAQAIEANFAVTNNIIRLLAWMVFWTAHLVLAVLAMALLWWFQVTPQELMAGWSHTRQSAPVALAGVAGLSVLGVLSGYLMLAQWVWRKPYIQWQANQLMRGL